MTIHILDFVELSGRDRKVARPLSEIGNGDRNGVSHH
jgi:hypothetical protein